jgi:hypothetical protein
MSRYVPITYVLDYCVIATEQSLDDGFGGVYLIAGIVDSCDASK